MQVEEEEPGVKVQETRENARDEDTNVEYADLICDELFEELVMIIDECSLAAPICDQPSDEVLVPVRERSSLF